LVGHFASTKYLDTGDLLFERGKPGDLISCILDTLDPSDPLAFTFEERGTVDIVGGTGRFSGARGTETVFQRGQLKALGAGVNPDLSVGFAAFGSANGAFNPTFTVPSSTLLFVDTPRNNATVDRPFLVGGWSIDTSAATGTGVDAIHVYAYPVAPASGSPVFLGTGTFGERPDVAAIYGARFRTSGFAVTVSPPPGTWDIVVFARSTVSGQFDTSRVVRVTVR
jgi:hypothetical protein